MDTVTSPEMVLNIPVKENTTNNIPSRVKRRLLVESKPHSISAQDIESKLHHAFLRRQQIYESLSRKARSKSRSGTVSSNDKYIRLQAKHKAAEQKRLMILGQIQNRLAKLDQLRQDAKNGAQLRFLKERNELSTKVALRLQQAETNRSLLLNAIRQRQVARRDRASQWLTRRQIQQNKYRDSVREAFYHKRAAAQKKRLGFLEAQKVKARASALQVQSKALAEAFENLKICQESVKSMPFERLAELLGSVDTINKVKALLHMIESHINISQNTNLANIDSLLKRVAVSGKRVVGAQHSTKLFRYPVRVVLGAYIISGHPDVASCEMGNYEIGLVRAAEDFLKALELLVKIMLQEPVYSSEQTVDEEGYNSQLEVFDRAWCYYLNQFVTWKVKDSKSLKEDLVRAASQLESTRDSYNKILEGDSVETQVQRNEHHTSGNDGVERVGTSGVGENLKEEHRDIGHVVESVLNREILNPSGKVGCDVISTADEHQNLGMKLVNQNVAIVNELLHGHRSSFAGSLIVANEDHGSIKSRVRNTMEKAFWDGVMETLKRDTPDYSWVVKLIEEVRDELVGLSPSNWRQEIDEHIDLDTLAQVLQSDTLNVEYCGGILKFSLDTLQKLSAPAKEDELKTAHEKLLRELAEISHEESNATLAIVIMKGLRFVLKEIRALKQEMSKARFNMLEPLIKGSAGLDYLRNNFTITYGTANDAPSRLPLVSQWLSSVVTESEQNWSEYMESLSDLKAKDGEYAINYTPATLRTGGSYLRVSTSSSVAGDEQPECKGERVDLLLRLGLLKLVNQVEGLTAETLPETLQLNLLRLRNIQSQLQKIIVICTSILVLRQTLISELLVTSAQEMESVISDCVEKLSLLLDSVEDVGLSELVETMNSCYANSEENPEKIQARKDIMSNMLGKSLSAGDAIFSKVSRSIYLASRGVVLGGNGQQGKRLAEAALQRVGAASLTEKLVHAIQELIIMANVSKNVHLDWYEKLLGNIIV